MRFQFASIFPSGPLMIDKYRLINFRVNYVYLRFITCHNFGNTIRKEVIRISGLEYLQYLTEKSIEYVNMTQSEKGKRKKIIKEKKMSIPAYHNHWFGVLPFILRFIKKGS